MLKKLLLFASLLVAICTFAQQTAPTHFDGKTWWDYVKVLADDNMEGRETGGAGLQRAEAYIVEQLKHAGIQPASSDGYYQQIKFQSREIVEKDSSVALVRDGKAEPLILGEDAFFSTRVSPAITVGPHWMIMWPFDPTTTGLPTTHKPTGAYVMWAGSPYAHLHVMGRP